MERRKFLKQAGLAGILAAGVAPAVHAQAALRWRIASSFPKTLDTIYGAAEVFAGKMKELSGGKVDISVHAGGELMAPFAVMEAVQRGEIEGAHTISYYFHDKNEAFAIDAAIPFGLNSRQMNAWMLHGNGLKLMREFFAGYNIVNFPCGNTGAQMGGWYRNEIRSMSDIKGLKMRLGGFAARVFKNMGGTPVVVPGTELFKAMEDGRIDAVEWVGPYDDQKLGFQKIAKNYVYPAWWEGGPQCSLYLGTKVWNSLSPELKAMVETASSFAHQDMLSKYDARNPRALKELMVQGVKLVRMPKDVMDTAYRSATDLYADISGKNPAFKKIYDDYAAFRSEQNQWFRLSELGFDTYMHNQRF